MRTGPLVHPGGLARVFPDKQVLFVGENVIPVMEG
jgi:hypothetical protein